MTEAAARAHATSSEGGSPDGSTRDLFAADPSGIVFQLHYLNYCGGSGALGTVCTAVEPSPTKGPQQRKERE